MLVTMTDKELYRLGIIQRVFDRALLQRDAADILELSVRQVQRLVRLYRTDGATAFASSRRGRPANNRIDEETRCKALDLIRCHYSDFGPTLATEKLAERHHIHLSVETVRNWMTAEGLWRPHSRRRTRVYQPRYRRDCLGELVQIDGSHHDWFEGRAPKCCLLVFMDDATGRLMHLRFCDTANIYSGGSSEEITGKALREMARRDEIVVATKTFFPWRNSPNTGFLSRKAIFQSIDDSLMRLGMDYVDLFQIHRFDYSTPVEETMEALHDLVKAGKARYIGASSMEAWRFAKMQHTAERNGWTRFITMQPQYNLLYREEEREMLPLCEDQGVGVIPWSPMARGRLTRDWSVTSRRTQNDAFALKMYENAALLDKPVIDVVASIAEKHAVPRAHVAIAWLLSKSVITAPIIGATKPEHLSTAISALDFSLSDAEITELEARYLPHPVDGIIPPLPDTPPSLTPPSAFQNY
nr:aldo/keto reductase [Klebsiella pneumoniae]